MDNNEALFKSIFALSESNSKALAKLNQQALKSITNALSNDISVASTTKISLSNLTLFPQINEKIYSLSENYSKLFSKYTHFDSTYISNYARFQISSILQLSQSVNTTMIKELINCFSNARYNEIIKVLNNSLSSERIQATDIAFIKTSELVEILNSELIFPKGLITSLNLLNKRTANNISNNVSLAYSTESKLFLSDNGEINSTGLNVICSGKELLSSVSGELFSENELIDFNSFLYRTPMLGTQNEVGIRIFNLIKELYKCGKHQINFDEDVYYHCRSRKKTEMPFVFDQMLKAPIGLPWAGRFNCPGRSYYYFSNTQKGAESEVKKHLKTDDVLQTVKIRPNCKIKLIDLSGTIKKCSVFLRYLRFNLPNTDDKWPKEYLLPSFVGECCKSVGFDGVKYYGAQDYNNYVTWSDGYFVYVGMCN